MNITDKRDRTKIKTKLGFCDLKIGDAFRWKFNDNKLDEDESINVGIKIKIDNSSFIFRHIGEYNEWQNEKWYSMETPVVKLNVELILHGDQENES